MHREALFQFSPQPLLTHCHQRSALNVDRPHVATGKFQLPETLRPSLKKKWQLFGTTVLKGALTEIPACPRVGSALPVWEGHARLPPGWLALWAVVSAWETPLPRSAHAGRPALWRALCHRPACHRCARPGRPRCSAHTSSRGGPSSPRTRHPRAAGSPSSGPGYRGACTVTRRFPATETLVTLSSGRLCGHED